MNCCVHGDFMFFSVHLALQCTSVMKENSKKSHSKVSRKILLFSITFFFCCAVCIKRTFGNNVAFVDWLTYNGIIGGACSMRCFLRYQKLYVIGTLNFPFTWRFCHHWRLRWHRWRCRCNYCIAIIIALTLKTV